MDELLCEIIIVIENYMMFSVMYVDLLLLEISYFEVEDLVDSFYVVGLYNYMIVI